jgi:hypothetical protein
MEFKINKLKNKFNIALVICQCVDCVAQNVFDIILVTTVANYLLFHRLSPLLLFCFIILPLECGRCVMPEGASIETQTVD